MSINTLRTYIIDTYVFNYKNIIKSINRKIKKDDRITGTSLPVNIDDDNFIILLKNTKSNEVLSFIWCGFYSNKEFGEILHVNFSYTFIKYRNNGYNKLLRLELEQISKQNKINYITSTPFEHSHSKNILIKLNYKQKSNYFYKKIY